jgi:hypothetical protein
MPLRQPPAEQPFSQIPPNWNPVSNDRVLLHLELINFANIRRIFSQDASFEFESGQTGKNPTDQDRASLPSTSQNDGFCHFDSDGFCRFTPILRCGRLALPASRKN